MTPSTSNPSPSKPDAFGEAARSGLTAINAAVLTGCTLVGAALTLYADLFAGPAAGGAGYVALGAWGCGIVLALYLAGRGDGSTGAWRRLRNGVAAAAHRPAFTALILMLTAGAALTAWSKARSDQGGLLRSLLASTQRTEAAAVAGESRTQQIQREVQEVRRAVVPATPAERLAKLGLTTKPEDVCTAIESGNEEAVAAYAALPAGSPSTSIALGGGQFATCLEHALADAANGERTARLLKLLSPAAKDLDRPFFSQTLGFQESTVLRVTDLLRRAKAPQGSRVKLFDVTATPIMFATWANNAPVVAQLLAMGAKKDATSHLGFLDTKQFKVEVTPLAEAQRLGMQASASVLVTAGATARTTVKGWP